MITRMLHSFGYAAIATALMVVAAPFLPSSVFIDLRSVTVENGAMIVKRDVLVPVRAWVTYEVESGSGVSRPDCNLASGDAILFERRDAPFVWNLPCDLDEGDYTVRYSVSVSGWFGLTLKPAVLEGSFVIGPSVLERVQLLEKQLSPEGNK